VVKLSSIRELRVSEFLGPSDVKSGDTVEILDEGVFKPAGETPFGRPVFQVRVRTPGGDVKTWTMNKTTMSRLEAAWGDETKNWVGKKVRVELVNMSVRGQFRTVVFGYPVVTEEKVVADEARKLLENMKAAGLKRVSTSDLEKFLRFSGLKVTAEEFIKGLGLTVKNGEVQL